MNVYKVLVNNGFRFEYVGTAEGKTIIEARRKWLHENRGTLAGMPDMVKLKR